MLFLTLLFSLLAAIVLWMWQLRSGRADWVDVLWAGLIGVLALCYALTGEGSTALRVLAVLVAGSWSLRLSWHLARRLAGHDEEDGRYQAMRKVFGHRQHAWLLVFFLGQGLVAWLFALPAWVLANHDGGQAVWVIGLGLGFWLTGLVGESIADRQLAAFRSNPANLGKVCDVGLWRYSRHPNYFFEWVGWFAWPLLAAGADWQWITWLAPLLMLLFLYRVTGIPYTEKQAVKSRGEAYRTYQRTTSAFIPWFRRPDSDS